MEPIELSNRKRRVQKSIRYRKVAVSDRHRSFTGLQVPGSTFLDRCRDAIIAAAVAVRGVPSTLKDSFNYVHEFPKEIWAVFFLKFLESYSYFAVSQILVIYLHTEFAVSDITAGAIYGMWGAIITLTGILTSWINDSLGVRKATLFGFFLSCISFIILGLTISLDVVYAIIFFLLPLGESMGIPMLTVAIRRCTTRKNRGFAFGLYYSVMNIAALVSGPVVDGFNIGLPDGIRIGGRTLSGNRCVILTCALATFCSFMVSLLVLKDIKVVESDSDGETISSPIHTIKTGNDADDMPNILKEGLDHSKPPAAVMTVVPVRTNPWDMCSSLCTSPTFWRYAALTLLLVNLHAVFRHLDATLPTYLVRIYGNGVPKGMIYSINPFMIIFLTPLVAAMTSVSPFFLVASTSIWSVCMMVVLISLGEAIWSPRVYDYVMSIAPEGKEASFSALASAPLFAAKIPVGLMSGYLLAKYVPEDENAKRQPELMWLYIGLLTISSPILITIFDSCIREPDKNCSVNSFDSDECIKQQRISGRHNGAEEDDDDDIELATEVLCLDGTYDDGEDVLDESQSLLSKATIPRNFTDLIKTDKKVKYTRSISISSNEAEELCAVTPVDKFDGETFSGHGSAYLRREISDDIDMYSSHTEHNNQEVDTLAILHQDRAVENHQQPKNTNNLIICD